MRIAATLEAGAMLVPASSQLVQRSVRRCVLVTVEIAVDVREGGE